MWTQPSLAGALLAAALLCAPGCTDGSPEGVGGTGTGAAGGSGGTGGTGGSAGEPLPPLDPAACPVTADSGQDPAIAEAAAAQWSAAYVPPESGSIEQDKAFFLATLLGKGGGLLAGLAADPALAAIGQDRDDRIRAAPALCAEDVACYMEALAWSETDAQGAADALEASLTASGELAALAADMRASGRFALHAAEADGALVHVAFRDLAVALGKTLGDEVGSLGGAAIHDVVEAVISGHPEPFVFFEPLLLVDLAALAADLRDEGSRYEPLEEGENAAAVAHIPDIEWAKFPFTVILVPGMGPTSLDVALSPAGQARADLAAQRFAAGIAPLVAVSGGHVHPDRTPYCEAIEMKKYLRDTHGIPEEAILVDPHARHTTTNLRNVSRLLYRHGVPVDRPVLVTSDLGQSIYIGHWHGTFGPRCMEELGYLPWRSLVPISENDACAMPAAVSLHGDGRDPLDP